MRKIVPLALTGGVAVVASLNAAPRSRIAAVPRTADLRRGEPPRFMRFRVDGVGVA